MCTLNMEKQVSIKVDHSSSSEASHLTISNLRKKIQVLEIVEKFLVLTGISIIY